MNIGSQPPWASGPGEILKHGLSLLKKDSDSNRRLAMISIDNSVELMIKTYLGLPQRITGLKITRKNYQEFSESFPKLLDALEENAVEKINGIDLGEIEWYHRLRNQLYHQGNGLTVEHDKVEVYAELANVLFANLFGFRLVQPDEDETLLLGKFIQEWVRFEQMVTEAAKSVTVDPRISNRSIYSARMLAGEDLLSESELSEIEQLRTIRNEVVHGVKNHKEVLTPEMITKLQAITNELETRLNSIG